MQYICIPYGGRDIRLTDEEMALLKSARSPAIAGFAKTEYGPLVNHLCGMGLLCRADDLAFLTAEGENFMRAVEAMELTETITNA